MELLAHHTAEHSFNSNLVFGSLFIIALVVLGMYAALKGSKK